MLTNILDRLCVTSLSTTLAEEHKLDNILSETQRNREMCNQIARKVFSHEPTAPEDPPVGPNVS